MKLEEIYFSALLGSIYHSLRASFLDKVHRFLIFTVIIVSSSSLVTLLMGIWDKDFLISLFSFAALLAGTVDIVFDITIQSRKHEMLSRRWDDLIEKMDSVGIEKEKLEKSDYEQIIREYHHIGKDEPAMYNGLSSIAYNMASRGYNYDKTLVIPWYIHLLKNFWKFSGRKPVFEKEQGEK